jgi:tetratricopeptide (TPR) repeat protein
MSRDAVLAAVSLLSSVGCYVLYAAARHEGDAWAWAMLASLASLAFFAARAGRRPPPVVTRPAPRPETVVAPREMRAFATDDPRLAETELRLAAFGVTLDPREAAPDSAFRRGLARAALETGAAHLESGHTDDALSAFDTLLQDLGSDPLYARTRAATHALRAMAYEQRAEPAQARVEYLRALELDPEQRQAQEALERLG